MQSSIRMESFLLDGAEDVTDVLFWDFLEDRCSVLVVGVSLGRSQGAGLSFGATLGRLSLKLRTATLDRGAGFWDRCCWFLLRRRRGCAEEDSGGAFFLLLLLLEFCGLLLLLLLLLVLLLLRLTRLLLNLGGPKMLSSAPLLLGFVGTFFKVAVFLACCFVRAIVAWFGFYEYLVLLCWSMYVHHSF